MTTADLICDLDRWELVIIGYAVKHEQGFFYVTYRPYSIEVNQFFSAS